MPRIEFIPAGRTLEIPGGTALLEAARQAGVEIELPCAGEGTCGRCIVRVRHGKVNSDSIGLLPDAAIDQGYVLACRTRIVEGPVTVVVPRQIAGGDGYLADEDGQRLVDAALLPTAEELDPLVVKWSVVVPLPQLEDGLADLDRLTRAMRGAGHPGEVVYALPVLRAAADAVRADRGRVTVAVRRVNDAHRVIGIEAGTTSSPLHGIAVDIGTTTVAVQLVDLISGQILGSRSDYNGQIGCGVDVISRINYAATPARLQELRTRVLHTVNQLVCEVSVAHGVNPRDIWHAVVSGNTIMTHLLLGLKPEYIRLEPYTPTVLEPTDLTAAEIGLGIATEAPVEFSPCVGSYVGGDITAGLLCTELGTDADELCLFMDIGTNGELVVGGSGLLMGCACSAGPAFEGGGIGSGVRASTGAIERVSVDRATAEPTCSTIGAAPPRGICGSGMIDLLANLLRTGWIDRGGSLDRSRASRFVQIEGKSARFVLVPAEKSATGDVIAITEADIENVLRAKAAIYSASTLMLERIGLDASDLRRIYVAGSFGRFLDLEQAILIGMLPDVPRERFRYLGNASLMGSYMALVSRGRRRRQLQLARRMTYLELSTDPAFMDYYTAALFLPHTRLERFPSAAAALRTGAP